MLKRSLRITLQTLMAIGVAIAVLVAVLLLTPVGARVAASVGWSRAAGDSGLVLSIDSTSGSVLRGITFEGVSLACSDGTKILEAARLEARLGSLGLRSKHVGLADVRMADGTLLFETDRDGTQKGWSRLGGRDASSVPKDSDEKWTVSFDLSLDDVTTHVRNEATGLDLTIGPVDGDASGTVEELEAGLAGAVVLETHGLRAPVAGQFEGFVVYSADGTLELAPLRVSTNAGDATVSGIVLLGQSDSEASSPGPESASGEAPPAPGPAAVLSAESSHDLAQLIALFGPEEGPDGPVDVSGTLSLSAELKGPFRAPAYSASLRGENLAHGATRIELLTASLEGDAAGLVAESLHAEGMGGRLDATASIDFPDREAGGGFPALNGAAEFAGIELGRLIALMPGGGDANGTLSGSADIDWASPGLSNLGVAFELNAGRLTAAGRDLGPTSVSGRLTGGLLVSSGSCCGVSLSAIGHVSDEGLRELDASLSVADLATVGSVFGFDGLEGSGTAEVTVANTGASPSLSASADLPDLRFRGVQAGPLDLEASGRDGVYGLLYEAFDSTLLGTASLEVDRTYSASVTARSFDLTAVLPDSLREAMSLAGLVSGVASASGEMGGAWSVAGEVSELDLAVRRQRATLTAPFSFAATPDSVSLTEASLAGTFGELSLAGSYTTSDVVDVALTFDGAQLSEIVDLLPRPPAVTPHGQVRGSVTLAGTRESPVFSADVHLRAFELYGLSLESATLEATGDSSDVIIDLSAVGSESGLIWISGGLPVRPDSLTLLALDAGREFGVSVASSGFVLDAREPILPGIRGEKRFRFDGSALLTGTADSLATVAGSGLLSELSASFDLAEFSLVDTVYFEVEHGSVVFDDLVVDVVRRHVLGEPYGGRVTAGGFVSLDGVTRIRAGTSDLDIGHLARALGGRSGAQLKGTLDGEALVEGASGEKRVSFSWKVRSPRLFDLGFDAGEGSGSFESGVLTLDRADLMAGGGTIGLSGRIATGESGADGSTLGTAVGAAAGSAPPELDLRLASDGLRLKRLVELPPGIDSIDGRLDVDLSVRGSAREPVIDGTALLTGGRLEGFGLAEPLTDIELDLQAGGTTVAVRRAQLRSGGGRVEASGLVDVAPSPSGPTFLVLASLKSPRFRVEDLAEGSVDGNVSWGGTPSRSVLKGKLTVKDAVVTRSVGLGDLVGRAPRVIVVRRADDPRANIGLNLDVSIEDRVDVESNLARLSLEGGASIGGTLLSPRVSGSLFADGGTFTYLSNDFEVEQFKVDFIEAERHDPYITLTGTADVESRTGEEYSVRARVDGYLNDVVPEFTSTPALSQPDIMSLLTFGNTFGALVSGDGVTGSSGSTFTNLAQRAFLSSAFGLAEQKLERLLRLDTVAFESEKLASDEAADADVMLGKEFGDRLRVNYRTSVGRLSNQRVEVSFELARRLWLETRTNPEGNHAIGVKLRVPFK